MVNVEIEAPGGFEPPHKGFADLSLTTWVRRHAGKREKWKGKICRRLLNKFSLYHFACFERETGLEPATSTLARLRSTN